MKKTDSTFHCYLGNIVICKYSYASKPKNWETWFQLYSLTCIFQNLTLPLLTFSHGDCRQLPPEDAVSLQIFVSKTDSIPAKTYMYAYNKYAVAIMSSYSDWYTNIVND